MDKHQKDKIKIVELMCKFTKERKKLLNDLNEVDLKLRYLEHEMDQLLEKEDKKEDDK